MDSFINGINFSTIADFIIDFDQNNLNTNVFKKNSIIFCKTDFIDGLFKYIELSGRKYIFITHLSDYPINEIRFKKAPKSIIKWYAENAIYEHDKLVSIPLGLENHRGKSKGKFTNHEWFIKNVNDLKKVPKEYKLYCNWNPDSNREVRIPILEKLKSNNIQLEIQNGISFEDYCINMAKYKFVVCPPGNGIDTHRLWEALYLGCYPIVIGNRIYRDYSLPILQIKDWSDVTKNVLDEHLNKWKDISNFSQLKMSYWLNLIKESFNKI